MSTYTREPFGDFTKVTLGGSGCRTALQVIPEKGAKIISLKHFYGDSEIELIEGYATPEDVDANAYSKSSILAPFPNRIADGRYEFEGEMYQLPINMPGEHNSIHGFVEHERFEVVDSHSNNGVLEIHLRHTSEGERKGYPFPFLIDIWYRISDTGLEVRSRVTNTGQRNMPFGLGWHPYFTFGGNVDSLKLSISPAEELLVDERLIPTGQKKTFEKFGTLEPISKSDFDTGFKFLGEERKVYLEDPEKNIELCVDMGGKESVYPFVQLFIPPWRGSVAIEPMTCAANAFNSRDGLQVLAPREVLEGVFTVSIRIG